MPSSTIANKSTAAASPIASKKMNAKTKEEVTPSKSTNNTTSTKSNVAEKSVGANGKAFFKTDKGGSVYLANQAKEEKVSENKKNAKKSSTTSLPRNGHVRSTTQRDLPFCKFCWKSQELDEKDCYGHDIYNCTKLSKASCQRCGQTGHTQKFCETPQCSKCLLFGHETTECNTPWCNFCWIRGFSEEESSHCPEDCKLLAKEVCGRCEEKGHTTRHCTAIICDVCGEEHLTDDCDVECTSCGKVGHYYMTCKYVQDYIAPRGKNNTSAKFGEFLKNGTAKR